MSATVTGGRLLRQLHQSLAPVVVVVNGTVGVAGLLLMRRTPPPRWFVPSAVGAFAVALVQVILGVSLLSSREAPGSFHTFYGMVIAFTLAFTYIYRFQLAKRPMLGYSLIALFVMGLGIRGWMNFGVDL